MTPELASNPVLSDALVILGAAGLVIPIFARFRITPVIGFILVGALVGPFGLGRMVDLHPWLYYVTITNPQGLDIFAEFGIILLLFSVGLELSFGRLWAMRRQVFGLGALELIGSAVLIGAGLVWLGNSPATALALGLALALSSTALVLRITDTRTPVGRAALSMLLFEDIALVPIIFLLGAMGRGGAAQTPDALWRTLWLGALTIALLMILGRLALPRLFAQAARTKSPELFLAASLLVVIAASLATAGVGLSPIVGALIAGLLIAETEYHTEVEGMTAPFKGLALGIFLITVGMGLDFTVIWARLAEIAMAVALVLGIKALVTGLLLRMMGARIGTSTEAGILLSSPSETTLIVLTAAVSARLISAESVLANRHRPWPHRHAAAGRAGQASGQASGSRRATPAICRRHRWTARDHHRLWPRRAAGGRYDAIARQALHRHRQRRRAGHSGAARWLSGALWRCRAALHAHQHGAGRCLRRDPDHGRAAIRPAAGAQTARPARHPAHHRPRPRCQPRRPALSRRGQPCGARNAGKLASVVRSGAGRSGCADGLRHRFDS